MIQIVLATLMSQMKFNKKKMDHYKSSLNQNIDRHQAILIIFQNKNYLKEDQQYLRANLIISNSIKHEEKLQSYQICIILMIKILKKICRMNHNPHLVSILLLFKRKNLSKRVQQHLLAEMSSCRSQESQESNNIN